MDDAKLTLSEVEEMTNSVARKFAETEYGIPPRAIQVVLWPTDKFICAVERGPCAVIRLGIMPGHPDFKRVLKSAIRHIYEKKMWESMEVELVADILRRNEALMRNLWKSYNFDPSRLKGMLRPEEITTKVVTRVEAYHSETKLREVVEVEHGSVFGAMKLAETRLARRVAEIRMMQTEPWKLPDSHPEWIAKTN